MDVTHGLLYLSCFIFKYYLQCSGDGVGGRWEFLKPRWLDAGDDFKCVVTYIREEMTLIS